MEKEMRTNARTRAAWYGVAALMLVVATGCTDQWETEGKRLGEMKTSLLHAHQALGGYLDKRVIANAILIEKYAEQIARDVPQAAEIANELSIEATRNGRSYRQLGERTKNIQTKPTNESELSTSIEETTALAIALQPDEFEANLADVVNVLADLSEGKLPKISGPTEDQLPSAGAGERLVGNPTYGRWERDSSGLVTWVFIGYLAGLGNQFYNRPGGYLYNDWYERRPWSYYSDHARERYGPARDKTRWRETVQRKGQGASSRRRATSAVTQQIQGNKSKTTSTARNTAEKKKSGVSGSGRSVGSTYAPTTTNRKDQVKKTKRRSTWGSGKKTIRRSTRSKRR